MTHEVGKTVLATPQAEPTGWLSFENDTHTALWIAIKYLNEEACSVNGWKVEGWWKADSGQIVNVIQLKAGHNSLFYYYAMDQNGTSKWVGTSMTYVINSRFAHCATASLDATLDLAGFLVGMSGFKINLSSINHIYLLSDSDHWCNQHPMMCLDPGPWGDGPARNPTATPTLRTPVITMTLGKNLDSGLYTYFGVHVTLESKH